MSKLFFVVGLAAALAWPSAAAAHSRAPAVALDFRLRITGAPQGVRADVIDGDRELRLRAASSVGLVVRGLLGEPLLRFAPDGVWVNGDSPTASADRLVQPNARGWRRLTRGHSFRWHDHRLSPPSGLAAGSSVPWSLPVVVNGRMSALTGTFTRVRRPSAWAWLGAAVAALAGVVLLARRRGSTVTSVLATVAAAAALVANYGFARGDAIAKPVQWLAVATAASLTLLAVFALSSRERARRTWMSTVVGAVSVALTADALSVFWHGVVISSLPASLARTATAVAFVGGGAAAILGVFASETGPEEKHALQIRAPA
jgi:hypothetical protein